MFAFTFKRHLQSLFEFKKNGIHSRVQSSAEERREKLGCFAKYIGNSSFGSFVHFNKGTTHQKRAKEKQMTADNESVTYTRGSGRTSPAGRLDRILQFESNTNL